jgi:hypothetical protein
MSKFYCGRGIILKNFSLELFFYSTGHQLSYWKNDLINERLDLITNRFTRFSLIFS